MSRQNLVAALPMKMCLAGHDLVVHILQPQQVPEAYRLVCAEAATGRDIGEDEFPSEVALHTHTHHAHSFGFSDPHTGTLRALVTVAPSAYSRMSNPLLADGIIVCEVGIKGSIIQALIQVAVTLTTHLGFEGVLADVFSTSELVGRLRAEGFTVIGCVPNSGHLKGRGWTDSLIMFKDLKASANQVPLPMMRSTKVQLRPTKGDDNTCPKRPHRSRNVTAPTSHDVTTGTLHDVTPQSTRDVTTHVSHDVTTKSPSDATKDTSHDVTPKSPSDVTTHTSHDITTKSPSEVTTHTSIDVTPESHCDVTTHSRPSVSDHPASPEADHGHILPLSALMHVNQKPSLHYLPCLYTFRTGEQVRLRYMQEADMGPVYAMYREAARQGHGFSTDEFTSMEDFRFCVIDHGHAILAEEVATSRILVAASILPNILCRSVDPQLADPYIIVDHHFQKKGIGSEVSRLMVRLIRDLGYAGILADALAENVPMLRIMRSLGFAIVGYIPMAARSRDHTMADIVLCFKDLEDRSNALSKL